MDFFVSEKTKTKTYSAFFCCFYKKNIFTLIQIYNNLYMKTCDTKWHNTVVNCIVIIQLCLSDFPIMEYNTTQAI